MEAGSTLLVALMVGLSGVERGCYYVYRTFDVQQFESVGAGCRCRFRLQMEMKLEVVHFQLELDGTNSNHRHILSWESV